MTTADLNEKQSLYVEKLVKRFEDGIPLVLQHEYERSLKQGKATITWEEFDQLQTLALAIHDQKQEQERRDRVKAKLASAPKALLKNDTSILVPPATLKALEAAIKELLPPDMLEEFNVALRKRSGAISYNDIAFVAFIHRDSVLNSGSRGGQYGGTSPFLRVSKASKDILKRGTPLDNRQIRYALEILVALEFTEQVEQHTHTAGAKKGENKAGRWTISDDRYWTLPFEVAEAMEQEEK